MNAVESDLVCPDSRPGNCAESEALARELTSLAGHINAANYRFLQHCGQRTACDGAKGVCYGVTEVCRAQCGKSDSKVQQGLAFLPSSSLDRRLPKGLLYLIGEISRCVCPSAQSDPKLTLPSR